MLNKVILIGRLTKDPELKYTPQGTAVTTFTLAVDNPFKKGEADFPNIVVWKKQAENVAQYTKKGSLVAVEGRIQTRSYENSEGKKVYVTEVVADNVRFLDTKKTNGNESKDDPFADDGTPIEITDDDLPF